MASFLHSQPIDQKALAREVLLLTGHTCPDKIELEKALHRWALELLLLPKEVCNLDGITNLRTDFPQARG